MKTHDKGQHEPLHDSEPPPMVDRELVLLIMVGTLLCVFTGWCWYVSSTQHFVIPSLLWISAAALLVIAVLTQKQEIFFQQSIDNNLDRKESLI